jgi:acyl-CoA synthetase (NDP forming)
MQTNDLHRFFEPSCVAIVGARRSPGFGYGIPIVLQRFGWGERLRLVNPSGGELHGLPVYKRIADVPDPVDLAIVIVPAAAVPQVLDEIGARGIRHVIIESAGFSEVDEDGRALQEEAKGIARKHGIRVIGPNCVGVINNANRFTTADILEEALTPGSTAIIAQSGVFGNILMDMLYEYKLYLSKVVTLGNRMDVNECDVLDHLKRDENTRVIMAYLEGVSDGRLFKETLQGVVAEKPVLILKSGRTKEGRTATESHTGSLSGEDGLYDAVFAQTGAIRANNLEELVEMTRVFSTQPPPAGNRLGVLTVSGSLGVLATDEAIKRGMSLPPASSSTVDRLRREAPDWMNVKNPLDIGPFEHYEMALAAMMEDPNFDMVLAITVLPFAIYRRIKSQGFAGQTYFGDIASIRRSVPKKPLVVCAVGHSEFVYQMREVSGPNVPVFISPEPAVRALAALHDYNARKRTAVPLSWGRTT